jgi:imidazolonepropionase-like amidohydrolase
MNNLREKGLSRGMLRLLALAVVLMAPGVSAQTPAAGPAVVFENVRIFDGRSSQLSEPSFVLVRGNRIERVSATRLEVGGGADVRVIDGQGQTLMPGLIDAHAHLMFANLGQADLMVADIGFVNIVAAKGAGEMLMRGFTSVRDLGGPVLGLKRGIDRGLTPGPRIWPSGAFISQTGGHGDFRMPNELPAGCCSVPMAETMNAAVIADDPDTVRKRAREQLALGASQLKLMAGGGVSSHYDPLDVTQYTVPELRAAVEAAENWGTYVTVHAYTPRAVRQALEAGVRCIDHGQLLDDDTVKLMAKKGVWWSLQPFIDDGRSAYAEGSPNRLKQLEMYAGTDEAFRLAKKHKVKVAFGTDILFNATNAARQTAHLVRMLRWYSAPEVLKMATHDNAQLLALSGKRSPYEGKLGVVEEGALADLLLVRGNPLENLEVLVDTENLLVIMKDGVLHKQAVVTGKDGK